MPTRCVFANFENLRLSFLNPVLPQVSSPKLDYFFGSACRMSFANRYQGDVINGSIAPL
jgi:hypothetical protein